MSRPVRSRRLVALLAAYVVALQALLLPLTVAAFAAPENVLCTAAGERSHPSSDHDSGCACAAGCGMQCGTLSLADAPSQDVIVLRAAHGFVVLPPLAMPSVAKTDDGIPHSPRAPPFV